MKNKMTIKHIEFWVSDLERSMKFYKGIFRIIGWDLIEDNAFSNGETKIYFIEQDMSAKGGSASGGKVQRTIGPRHICFLASSRKIVDAVGRFLEKSGHTIIRGPLESRYKDRSSYTVDFKDPDGYVIEVATKSATFRK